MGFLTPWFLAGIAALGLPVYIHLLRQYKSKPVPFSSLMFFERRTQSSIKHRRLKYLLLFALRCLFIALLVLAFSRPYIRSRAIARATAPHTVVFAVDNSYSMRQTDRFATAKQAALDAIRQMKEGDRGQVISFGGAAKLLTDITNDREKLRGAVTSLEPSDDANSYAELSRVLRSTAESTKSQVEAHVFTDDQKSALPSAFSDLKLDDGTKLVLHPVATKDIPNWTVESVEAPRRVYDTKKVRTVATIAGFGTEEATRKVTLLANGKELESKQVKVPPGGRATVEFLALEVPYGFTRCEIRIDSADAFPADDQWLFSVERADPKPVLLLHADTDTMSPLYIKTALEAAAEAPFTIESIPVNQSANLNVAKYALVILSDPGPLPEKLQSALDSWIRAGGSVLMTLGKNSQPGRHIPFADLQDLGLRTIQPDREGVLTVASVDTSYPAFSAAQNWGGVNFYQVARLQLPESAPDVRVAAQLSDGTPLLIDRTVGGGHAVVFTSPIDNVANNLPVEPVWLPFLDQLTRELGGVGAAQSNYKVGSYVELRSSREKGVPVEITGPDNKRLLSLSESAEATNFQFPSAGFFDIRRANGREELAAVNPDRRESDLTLIPQETLELWKNTGIAPKGTSNAQASGSPQDENAELWWWVLLALALLAVTESWLGNRHMTAEHMTSGRAEEERAKENEKETFA